MTIHITWSGVLMVIGAVAVLYLIGYVLLCLWIMFRWGK